MCFYLTFSFLGFKVVNRQTMNLFKGSEDFWFSNFIWLDWKVYKPALCKLDSSWDNSYFVRLVISLLAVNVGRLQLLVSEHNFFCWVFNSFCSDFLISDRLSSFETFWSSLLHFLMALGRSLLRIEEPSFLKHSAVEI